MAAIKNSTYQVMFRTTREVREKLEHHAKRLGADMNDIVREATIAHLEILDEKEMIALEAKRERTRRGAYVPTVEVSRFGKAPGLGLKRPKQAPTSTIEEVPVAPKLERSFRRWAEFIEAALDRADGERRAQTVLEDIRERASSDAEIATCYDKLKEFLKARADARRVPKEVIDVAGDIEGDA